MPKAFQSRNEELKCQVRPSRKVGRAGKITGWLICANDPTIRCEASKITTLICGQVLPLEVTAYP